ncbi:MAG: right-handed parallel beta-helix repeat-containing protein [Pirellulales bacterium]|nr:right-handed parallel beta-helix repeat-containing protein [Pirellulales bacterium]
MAPDAPSFSNIRITGGTIKSLAHDAAYEGTHLSMIKVQYLSIEGVRFEGVYNRWNASFIDCQDVKISGVVMNSGENFGEDGLHFVGGARIVVSDCNIRSGDDALALTQENFTPLATTDLTDFTAVNCYLHSAKANAFKAYVRSGVTRTISRVRLANIVAKVGGTAPSGLGIDIHDENNDNRVSEVEIDGVTLDASEGDNGGLRVKGVSNIRLANTTILRPKLAARIDGSTDVELRNVVIDRPQTENYGCLRVAGEADCTNIRIRGGRYSGALWHNIAMGVHDSIGPKVTGFEVSGALIEGAKYTGLFLLNASDGIVVGNTITGSGNPELGYGISEIAPYCDRNLIISNWLADNYSGPVSFTGSSTEVVRNFGTPLQPIADSGGFRQTIDGNRSRPGIRNCSSRIGRNRSHQGHVVAAADFAGAVCGVAA